MYLAFSMLGMFLGHWLVVPYFTKRNRSDGFWIGLLSAGFLFVFYWALGLKIS